MSERPNIRRIIADILLEHGNGYPFGLEGVEALLKAPLRKNDRKQIRRTLAWNDLEKAKRIAEIIDLRVAAAMQEIMDAAQAKPAAYVPNTDTPLTAALFALTVAYDQLEGPDTPQNSLERAVVAVLEAATIENRSTKAHDPTRTASL